MSDDHKTIYLAPECCASHDEGRQWCQDNVWPCNECPDRSKARVTKYRLDGYMQPPDEDF